MHSQSKKKKRKKVSSRKRMSGESGQLWPSHHQLPLSLCIWKGRFEKLALARRKAQGCVFVKASVKSCLRFKMGDASIISHRHIVWANWSLCLNNINLGSIFCPPLHTHTHTFSTSPSSFLHIRRQLRSVVPSLKKKYGGEHVGWHGTTEPSTPIYASCGDPATDVYEVQKCAKLSASNILQPAALPRTLLTLKVWPQFGGRLKKKHARVLLLLLRCTCAAVPYFYHRDCLQFFTKMEVN